MESSRASRTRACIQGQDRAGESTFEDKVVVSRQVYLRSTNFEEHGMTRGCPKCDQYRRTASWTGRRPHPSIRRARITAELMRTAVGRTRIGAASERLQNTAEELRQHVRCDSRQGEKWMGSSISLNKYPPHFLTYPSVLIKCLAVTQVSTMTIQERCPPLLMSQACAKLVI